MPEPREVQRTTYVQPRSLSDAKIVRRKLVEEIAGINTQLSNRNKMKKCTECGGTGASSDTDLAGPDPAPCSVCTGTGGIRWPDHEYHTWRQRALTALRARESVLRRLNDWIEEEMMTVRPNATALIHDAHNLFLTLLAEDTEFNDEEMAVIESLGTYLNDIDKEPTCQA